MRTSRFNLGRLALFAAAVFFMADLIPTNIITGFLGVGKTTAITHLLTHKPPGEVWSILVNEFGEVGIDGALFKQVNAHVREVAGGCICCAAGLPMKMALNMLIATTKPDRLIIEPTGLGHPAEIINTLTGEYYDEVLDLQATLTLIDPRKLSDERYTSNQTFQDQIAVADVLIANKMDVCTPADEARFDALLAGITPAKQASYKVTQGQLKGEWLRAPRISRVLADPNQRAAARANPLSPARDVYNAKVTLPAGQDFTRRTHQSGEATSCGWLFAPHIQFNFNGLFGWLSGMSCWRAKAVMNTEQGIYVFNAENGVLSVSPLGLSVEELQDSRIELIDDKPIDAESLEAELLALRCHPSKPAGK